MLTTQLEQGLTIPEDSTIPVPDPDSLESAESRKKRFRQGLVQKQQGKQVRLKAMLLELRRRFRTVDADARRRHLQQIDMMFRYHDGDMYGGYSELGVYKDDRQDGDFAYAIPVLAGHVGEAFMQLMKVSPDYIVTANDSHDDNMNRLARMCEELGTENLERIMQEDERQTEVLNSILAGDSFREILWAVNPKAPKKAKRIRQVPVQFEIPGRRECVNCQAEAAEGATECQACGVASIKDIPGGMGTRYNPEEYEVELGENCLRIPHPMGIQSDLSALRFEDSTHVIEHDYLEKHIASWSYQTPIEASDLGMSEEMQARHNLERSSIQMDAIVGSTRQWGRGTNGRKVERERHFWDVAEYGWIYCEVEEPLPNPVPDPNNPQRMVDKIPAKTLLGDFFCDGAYVVYLGETIADIQPCKKKRRWVKIQYGKRPGSSVGMGAKLLAMLNDILNDDYNLVHAIKHTSARPFTVVAGKSVKLLPEAGQFLRIDQLPIGVQDIRAVIAQYPGQSAAGMDATSTQIQQAMQFIFGSYTLGAGGAPDMQNFGGTATEVTARVEQASGRQIGPIGQRIAADKETILICLENIQEYSTKEQRAELAKRFGPDIVDIFFKTNLRHTIKVGIKPNTDIPRWLAMQQAGRAAFAEAAANLVPIADKAPWVMEFLEDMADSYGMPLSIGKSRSDRRKAEERLNKLAAIEERTKQKNPEAMSDPQAAAQVMYAALVEFCGPLIAPEEAQLTPEQQQQIAGLPPETQAAATQQMLEREQLMKDIPRIFIQDHETFMDAYKDELFSEKAMTYSPARILVIIKLWEDHFFAMATQEIEKAKIQKALQDQMNPQPQEPNPQDTADAQSAQDMQRMAIEHEAGQETADNEARRQMALKEHEQGLKEQSADNETRRKMALDSHNAQNQIAVNDAKPEVRTQ